MTTIMNFLNLFNRKKKHENQDESGPTTATFQPNAENELSNSNAHTLSEVLADFLEKDYLSPGFNDGYIYHQTELRDVHLRTLKSNFRHLLTERIDYFKRLQHEVEKDIVDMRGLSESLEEKNQIKINKIRSLIDQLEKEYELSIDGEGLIARVLNEYKEGYLRGTIRWTNLNNKIENLKKF